MLVQIKNLQHKNLQFQKTKEKTSKIQKNNETKVLNFQKNMNMIFIVISKCPQNILSPGFESGTF